MSIFKDGLIRQGASGAGDAPLFQIDQSIRFDPAATGRLTKTFGSSASNRRTHTYSFWTKIGQEADGTNSSGGCFFLSTNDTGANAGDYLHLNGSLQLRYWSNESSAETFKTNRLFRDHAAWYHIVLVNDRDTDSSNDAVRVYINGERETNFAVDNIAGRKGQDTMVNASSFLWQIQRFTSLNVYGDCYMAEIHFVDGYAYGPEYFGKFSDDNIWIPIEYTESHGTNGFHIDGRDASDIGDDESGNGNDFTATNLATHDILTDTPTNNFCTINPIYADASNINSLTLTNGMLEVAGTSGNFDHLGFTFGLPKSGKWYFEYTIGGLYDGFGFVIVGEEGSISGGNGIGQVSASQGGAIQYQGWIQGASYTVNFGATFTAGHIHQVAIDVDNGKLYYGIQNTYYAADAGTDGNPSAGTNHLDTFDFSTNDISLLTMVSTGTAQNQHWNFGQNGTFNGTKTAQGNSDANGHGDFFYAVPTNYLSLCTKNLQA